MSSFKKAFVSVSDKTNLSEFLKPLVDQGLEVYSTGQTAKYLKDHNIPVKLVSELTEFPEVMDGRVKTLHPFIYMGLLYREGEKDQKLLAEYNVPKVDLLVVNLYPFEESLKQNKPEDQMIENIDIGGVSLLRAASKNYKQITCLCDPKDYDKLKSGSDLSLRKKLAAKAFRVTSYYDSLISLYLDPENKDHFLYSGKLKSQLRYGENPQSESYFYENFLDQNNFEVFQGKELSYNNLLDIDASFKTAHLFDKACCVAVKHNNPCGVALGDDLEKAISKSLKADPTSVFGAIVCVNSKIEEKHAKQLTSSFLECVLAPDYSKEALEVFQEKKNLRVIQCDFKSFYPYDVKSVLGGILVQKRDEVSSDEIVIKDSDISEEKKQELLFCWKVCARLKSNAICLTSGFQTVGLGMGQVSRVDACKQALERWKAFHPDKKDLIMASDGFFPFTDCVELAYENGIKWIVQPGGSIHDEKVIEKAKSLGIKMILTGKRHFLH